MSPEATPPRPADTNRHPRRQGTFVLAADVERYGIAAVMLAQLRWLTAEARHVKWVHRDGHDWIAYADNEWAEVVGLSTDQARRARRKLAEAGVVEFTRFRIGHTDVMHVRLAEDPGSDFATSPDPGSDFASPGVAEPPPVQVAESPLPPLYETGETTEGDNARLTARDGDLDHRFLATWAHYPRKLNRKGAYRAWTARVRSGVDPADLALATVNYARLRRGQDPAHTMHGATFFGPDERWRDYLDDAPAVVERTHRRNGRKQSKGERALEVLAEMEGRQVDPMELTR